MHTVRASRRPLIEELLKLGKDTPNLFRFAQIGHGVGDRVVILQPEQRSEFLLVEFRLRSRIPGQSRYCGS